jgi:hypothetical protein
MSDPKQDPDPKPTEKQELKSRIRKKIHSGSTTLAVRAKKAISDVKLT